MKTLISLLFNRLKGAPLLETPYKLGITPSRSRLKVSNGNPYANPFFVSIGKLFYVWVSECLRVPQSAHWYNFEHKHSGIKFVAPHQRHTGTAATALQNRQEVYERAKTAHPKRWFKKTKNWIFSGEVWLNAEKSDDRFAEENPA